MGAIPEVFADIRDYETLEQFIDLHKPSTIIHMAAQPLVLKSYESPRETFDVNVMGTINLFDIAFSKDYVKVIIVVTTDKVYRNDNSGQAFVESDSLEGKDPYSASKVGTEAAIAAWQQISNVSHGPKVVSVRAGNVIGGGDYAKDRIIPDIIRGVITGKTIEIRNPKSTRPWQHVLDPLVGYLKLIEALIAGKQISSLNFGPHAADISVEEVTRIGGDTFPILGKLIQFNSTKEENLESSQLQINSEKSRQFLDWEPRWQSQKAIKLTFQWWESVLEQGTSPLQLCKKNILEYFS
jgi:CDP-glucose 4,6-dehydratase